MFKTIATFAAAALLGIGLLAAAPVNAEQQAALEPTVIELSNDPVAIMVPGDRIAFLTHTVGCNFHYDPRGLAADGGNRSILGGYTGPASGDRDNPNVFMPEDNLVPVYGIKVYCEDGKVVAETAYPFLR